MFKELVELSKELNLPTLITIFGAVWWANRGLRADMKEVKDEIKSIHKEFKFINIRVSRLEGSFYGNEIYKQDKEGS
jgi:hypothetical protein